MISQKYRKMSIFEPIYEYKHVFFHFKELDVILLKTMVNYFDFMMDQFYSLYMLKST